MLASGEKKKNNRADDINGDGVVDEADQDAVREFIKTVRC